MSNQLIQGDPLNLAFHSIDKMHWLNPLNVGIFRGDNRMLVMTWEPGAL